MPQDLSIKQIEQTELWERELAEKRNKAKQAAVAPPPTVVESQNSANDSNQDQDQPTQNEPATTSPKIDFPKGILVLALCFDAVGFIPIVSFVTEPIAAIIFGYWQKNYQNADIFTILGNLAAWKGLDVLTIGILPSNAGLVIRAYMQKRAQNVI